MKSTIAYLFIAALLLSPQATASESTQSQLAISVNGSTISAIPLSSSDINRGIMSRNTAKIDIQALRNGSPIQLASTDNTTDKDTSPKTGQGFIMQLPGGTEVTLKPDRLQSFVKGVETYSGQVTEVENGHFTLSIENDRLFGQVSIEYMAYDIRFDEYYDSHVLTEIDLALMPKHSPEPLEGDVIGTHAYQQFSGPLMMSGSVNGTVRMLILHGSDVSYASALASNIVSQFNDSLFEDGMDPDFHVTLADLRNLNDDLDGLCSDEILEKMENRTAPFSSIGTWIANEEADVVLTIATTDPSLTCQYTGTWGRIGGQASGLLDSTKPFAVTADTYALGDLTAIHEIGHVMGGAHPTWTVAQLQALSSDAEPYSRGYISNTGDWQTIMGSYDANGCSFSINLSNPDCVRVPFWSDPDETYSGETRGVTYTSDTQIPYSANMKTALEFQMPIVAAFRSYPYSAPAVPSNFRVINFFCYGEHSATWNSVANAENYQLLRSYSSSFTNPEVIYFGPNTAHHIVVPPSLPWYLKVRACNGSGCGDLSAQKSATYYNNCL